MLNHNDLPDRRYNDLLAAALRGAILDEQDRTWAENQANATRRAHWRLRSLVQLGHWPTGDVADWRDACMWQDLEHDDGLGFFHGLVACLWLTGLGVAGLYLLGALVALRG